MANFNIHFAISIILFLSSCTMMIADGLMQDAVRYGEVESNWPQVNDNFGRVVIYFPRLALGEVNLIGGFGPQAGPVGYFLAVNNKLCGDIMDRLFIYYDLPPGQYRIKRVPSNQRFFVESVSDEGALDIDIKGGDIHYIKLNYTQHDLAPFLSIEAAKAKAELMKLRHRYDDVSPVNLNESDNFLKNQFKCSESSRDLIYGSQTIPKSRMAQEIESSPQGVLTTKQIQSLFQNKTAFGKHLARNYSFRRYFSPSGEITEVSSEYSIRRGKWKAEFDTLCFQFDSKENCSSVENRYGKVKLFAYRMNKPNKDIIEFKWFADGNVLDLPDDDSNGQSH